MRTIIAGITTASQLGLYALGNNGGYARLPMALPPFDTGPPDPYGITDPGYNPVAETSGLG